MKNKRMDRNRKRIAAAIVVAAITMAALAGVFQLVMLQRLVGVKDQRVVQILESSDGQLRAELIRKHAFLDLNFIIQLNGERIFTSPDFRPNNKIPFRETILWDKNGKNLIFEVGGQRLFGYSVTAKRQLSDNQLLALEVANPKPEDFYYSGHWPSLQRQGD